jgi:hypothetical protein
MCVTVGDVAEDDGPTERPVQAFEPLTLDSLNDIRRRLNERMGELMTTIFGCLCFTMGDRILILPVSLNFIIVLLSCLNCQF